VKRLSKHISLLELPQFQYPFCNCLWIEDEINCLVDSSPTDEELAKIKGKPVHLIVNSHGHIDHNRSNYRFPQAQVLLHETNHCLVASEEGYLREFGFDRYLSKAGQTMYLRKPGYRPRPADGFLEDGQIINVGETRFEVLHLPGHIYGHCGFIFHDEGFIYTGDIDLNRFGPWYGNISSDVDDFIRSINKLIEIQPDMMITSHGPRPVTSGIKSGLTRYRDIIYQREEEIVKLLYRGKHTVWEIGAELPIYKRLLEPREVFYLYECAMDWKHLQRLERQGRVERKGDKYYLNHGIRPSNLNLG